MHMAMCKQKFNMKETFFYEILNNKLTIIL